MLSLVLAQDILNISLSRLGVQSLVSSCHSSSCFFMAVDALSLLYFCIFHFPSVSASAPDLSCHSVPHHEFLCPDGSMLTYVSVLVQVT